MTTLSQLGLIGCFCLIIVANNCHHSRRHLSSILCDCKLGICRLIVKRSRARGRKNARRVPTGMRARFRGKLRRITDIK